MDALNVLNVPQISKKWKNNPQMAMGASALVGICGIVYLVKKLGSQSNETESHIPDFALPNDDREMTQRLTNIRNRRQARKHKEKQKQKQKQKPKGKAKSKTKRKDDKSKKQYAKSEDINGSDSHWTRSPNDGNVDKEFDTVGNDSDNVSDNDDKNDTNGGHADDSGSDENEENERNEQDGFNADEYYNPQLKIRKENMQRKPDAAFMALFGLYASNADDNNSVSNVKHDHDLGYMQQSNYNEPPFPQNFQTNNINLNDAAPSTMSFESKEAQDIDQLSNHGSVNSGIHGMNAMNAVNVANHNSKNNRSNNNGHIDSNEHSYGFDTSSVNHNIPSVNALDRLKDLYARNKLPPSLQPDSLSMSFRSNPKQAAVVNRGNDSIMSTIKQMI